MVNPKCVGIGIVISALVFFKFAPTVAAQGPAGSAGDNLLAMVPAESLFCVRINNLDQTLGQMDQFLAGLYPTPVSTLVKTGFAKMLGDPALKGVNTSGSFAVFGTITPGEPVGEDIISVLIPVTDYKQFISANPKVSAPDANGVSKITGGDGLVMQVGNFALLKSPKSYDRLIATAKSISAARSPGLASVLDGEQAKQAVQAQVWAYVNMQVVSKTFGPMLRGQIEQMKKMAAGGKWDMQAQIKKLEQMRSDLAQSQPDNKQAINMLDLQIEELRKIDKQSKGEEASQSVARMMNAYAAVLETLMNETRSLSVVVDPKPDVLSVAATVSAVPGTDMAKMFAAGSSATEGNRLLAYLEDGAAMNFAGRLDTPFWKELNVKGIDLFAAMMRESMSAEDIAKMKALVEDAMSCFGGPMAGSFLIDAKSKPPFALKYIVALKDQKTLNKVIDESAQLINTGAVASFYKDMGFETSFTLKRGQDRYKDISIDAAQLLMKSTDPNSPQGQMINALYGPGIDYRWAMVDGLWVCAAGGDSDSAIRKLIDQIKAGEPRQMAGEVKAALALLPAADKADFMATYNILRFLKMIWAFMPMAVAMPQVDIPTKSNMVFAGSVAGGKMTIDVALPKEHLMEIMGLFQKMQQQKTKRTQSRQTISAANLRGIGKACLIYANDYEDKFPPNLQELVEKVELSPRTLESPNKPMGFEGPSYIYVSGQTIKMDPGNILVYENPAFCSDMINVLFLDAHVEAMKPDEFLQKLEETYRRLGKKMPDIKFEDSTKPMR
jgi:prepilin-type processing-associated H-X9-DG protein